MRRIPEGMTAMEYDALPPGSDLGTMIGKKPWTWEDVAEGKMEQVTWLPYFTSPLLWNGLRLDVQEGVMVTTPVCFKTIHDDTIIARRTVDERIKALPLRGHVLGLDVSIPDKERPGLKRPSRTSRAVCAVRGHKRNTEFPQYLKGPNPQKYGTGDYHVGHACERCGREIVARAKK